MSTNEMHRKDNAFRLYIIVEKSVQSNMNWNWIVEKIQQLKVQNGVKTKRYQVYGCKQTVSSFLGSPAEVLCSALFLGELSGWEAGHEEDCMNLLDYWANSSLR